MYIIVKSESGNICWKFIIVYTSWGIKIQNLSRLACFKDWGLHTAHCTMLHFILCPHSQPLMMCLLWIAWSKPWIKNKNHAKVSWAELKFPRLPLKIIFMSRCQQQYKQSVVMDNLFFEEKLKVRLFMKTFSSKWWSVHLLIKIKQEIWIKTRYVLNMNSAAFFSNYF